MNKKNKNTFDLFELYIYIPILQYLCAIYYELVSDKRENINIELVFYTIVNISVFATTKCDDRRKCFLEVCVKYR